MCASPENCQGQYPTKLALAKKRAALSTSTTMTPSTQEEEIKSAAVNSGRVKGVAAGYSINNAVRESEAWETDSCNCSQKSEQYHRIVSLDDNRSENSLASSSMSHYSNNSSN